MIFLKKRTSHVEEIFHLLVLTVLMCQHFAVDRLIFVFEGRLFLDGLLGNKFFQPPIFTSVRQKGSIVVKAHLTLVDKKTYL